MNAQIQLKPVLGANGYCIAEGKPAPVVHDPKTAHIQCSNCGSFEASLGFPVGVQKLQG